MSAGFTPFSLPRFPKMERSRTPWNFRLPALVSPLPATMVVHFLGIHGNSIAVFWRIRIMTSGWRWSLITQNDNSKPCEEIWSWIRNYTGVWCMDLSCSTMVSGAPPKHREISGSPWMANIKPQLDTGDCSKHLMLSYLQWKWHGIIPQSSPVPKKRTQKIESPHSLYTQKLACRWLICGGSSCYIMEWDILGIALGISWTLFRYVGKKG